MSELPDFTILILEDDREFSEIYRSILSSAGYSVCCAATSREALESFHSDPKIGVVVIDLKLKDEDGLVFLKSVRSSSQDRPWVKAVIATGYGTMSAATQAMKLDAFDFLTKPFDAEEFLAVIKKAYRAAVLVYSNNKRIEELSSSLTQFKDQAFGKISELIAEANQVIKASETDPSEAEASLGTLSQDVDIRPTLKTEMHLARIRDEVFGDLSLSGASWMILLVLVDAHLNSSKLSVKSIAYSANIPHTTTLRKINELAALGLATKENDEHDSRRSIVQLSKKGISLVHKYTQKLAANSLERGG